MFDDIDVEINPDYTMMKKVNGNLYLSEEQMEIFNQNLVKNFSLQNVVESITILNPDKLLDEVEQAVGRTFRCTAYHDH